ncbi:MAG: hypothetical protein QHH07_08900, partial [Sedimentisphaerales bacterium]|nr:hypothetical protein [Sedimentisphaerales bacterium]
HDRARRHIIYWASRQSTSPIPDRLPPPDQEANLARCEAALHSNGDISNSHYDMNLVFIDMLFRHLLWTGDLDLARQLWPVIERHLAWERRLFRRPFGPDGLPLYEAYACFWASDDIGYNGGGTTVASSYNYWHNAMAARLARLLGKDPLPYKQEADQIRQAMSRYLWLADKGWLAEFRDLLGLQLAHEGPGLWSFYHAVDSEAIDPFEAWQMSRYVDEYIPHIPVKGPGVPTGDWYTVATTNWMPYSWSTNNVVMAEAMHTALAFWQIGRLDHAWRLFKGAILDSMYMGICPGNLGMCTGYDVYRREAQRDFADPVGTTARALIEGLFGIRPDTLAGQLTIQPGLPPQWDYARLYHPSIRLEFRRQDKEDIYFIEPNFPRPQALRLVLVARSDTVVKVQVDGKDTDWRLVEPSLGTPRIEIQVPPTTRCQIAVRWDGDPLVHMPSVTAKDDHIWIPVEKAHIQDLYDPQGILKDVVTGPDSVQGSIRAHPGHHCLFLRIQQGQMKWWEPVHMDMPGQEEDTTFFIPDDPQWELIDISSRFNDRLTRIFENDYLSPRSPYCSLSTPRQGIGTWCRPTASAQIDDSGLRIIAGRNGGIFRTPQGLPFMTPGPGDQNNVIFLSQWDNYPNDLTISLSGRARHLYLLMAGTTGPMQSRFDNGEVLIRYTDGTTARLALHNPTNWWPIDQDYFIDDFQFNRPGPIPPRVHLRTGQVYIYDPASFKGKGGAIPGGAATILDMPLDQGKALQSMTLRVLANEIVMGLLAVTLAR